MGYLVLFTWLFIAWRLIRKDIAMREGVSLAVWIPTLWAFILLSRPLSTWLGGFGGGDDSLEGSPLDRLFYFGLILASVLVLVRRGVNWAQVLSRNWAILLFYGFLLVSVTWAPASFVSLKRWIKDFGNVFLALVLLTEANPPQAIRAVFVRCAYVLLPLSAIFLRWFPNLGRRYTRIGALEVVGVTDQKNSLGILVVVCGLVLLWDYFERTKPGAAARTRFERILPIAFLALGIYLLNLCDSVTSMIAMVVGALILSGARFEFLRQRASFMGFGLLTAVGSFFALDAMFGIKGVVLRLLGRDESLTGRTDVWRELLAVHTDPFIGTGFCSIWSDRNLLSKLPEWVGKSAHNGYLEMYIDGGFIALFFLLIALLVIGWRLNRELAYANSYVLFRFCIFAAIIIGNVAESHWARMGPLWFVFLIVTFGSVSPESAEEKQETGDSEHSAAFAEEARQT